MKTGKFNKEIQELLLQDKVLAVADFAAVCPGLPAATVYSKIRALVRDGRLVTIGRGLYTSTPKPEYHPTVSRRMKDIHQVMVSDCEGVDFCVSECNGNLSLYASKTDHPTVMKALRQKGYKVISGEIASSFLESLEGYVVLENLISESPLVVEDGLYVPSLEKELVDAMCDRKSPLQLLELQKKVEAYPVNRNRLRRYAERRGVAAELQEMILSLNQERLDIIGKVQRYLSSTPVTKAWVFGSFARGEERPDSDLDLLVSYDNTSDLSLLDTIRFRLDLEAATHRKVDLVEDGYLKSFAIPSAERDKYLIYERHGER